MTGLELKNVQSFFGLRVFENVAIEARHSQVYRYVSLLYDTATYDGALKKCRLQNRKIVLFSICVCQRSARLKLSTGKQALDRQATAACLPSGLHLLLCPFFPGQDAVLGLDKLFILYNALNLPSINIKPCAVQYE